MVTNMISPEKIGLCQNKVLYAHMMELNVSAGLVTGT